VAAFWKASLPNNFQALFAALQMFLPVNSIHMRWVSLVPTSHPQIAIHQRIAIGSKGSF
jgi:hypothetical protein